MAVLKINRAFIACLYGNSPNYLLIREIKRDLVYEQELVWHEGYFWNHHVLAAVPPPYLERGDLVLRSVAQHHGSVDTSKPEIELSTDRKSNIVQFLELKEQKQQLDKEARQIASVMKRHQGIILDEMGTCSSAICDCDGERLSITNQPTQPSVKFKKDKLELLKAQNPTLFEDLVENGYITYPTSSRFHINQMERSQ